MIEKPAVTDITGIQAPSSREQDQVLALHAEEIAIAKRTVPRGTVRVSKVIQSRDHLIQETLRHQRVEVERIQIGTYVDHAPPIRHDGDVTIVSVVEEVVVTERRLLLKEEVRIRTVTTTDEHKEVVTLRSEEANVERLPMISM